MPENLRVLDTLSEWFVLSSRGNVKNVVVLAVEYVGRIDDQARITAIKKAVQDFPVLGCCVREIKKGPKRCLAWFPMPDREFPIIISDLPQTEQADCPFEAFVRYIKPWLDKEWNLFKELPGQYHVLKLSENRQISALVVHHSAAVGFSAGQFMAHVAGYYQEITTGATPEKFAKTPIASTVKKAGVKRVGNWRRIAAKQLKLFLSEIGSSASIPVGSGQRNDPDQHCVRRIISQKDTALLRESRNDGVRLIDRLAAAANIAIESWNSARHEATGAIATSVAVNLDGKYNVRETDVNLGFITIRTGPNHRVNNIECARHIAISRAKNMEKQTDLRALEAMKRLLNIIRFLPLKPRQRISSKITRIYGHSMIMSYLGVALPKVAMDSSGEEALTYSAGGTELADVFGFAYKLANPAPIVFFVYELKGELSVIITALAGVFTRPEADRFIDLFTDILRNFNDMEKFPNS